MNIKALMQEAANTTSTSTSVALTGDAAMEFIDAVIDQHNPHEQEINMVSFVIDDLAANIETLGSVSERFEAALETGGVTEGELALANATVERCFASYGLENQQVAGLESLNQAGGRTQVTTWGMESLTSRAKDVWKWILAQLKKMRVAIGKFYDAHISNLGRTGKALKSLSKAADEATGSPDKSTVESSRAQYLTSDGTSPSANIAKEIVNIENFIAKSMFNKEIPDAVSEAATKITEGLKANDNKLDKATATTLATNANRIVSDATTSVFSTSTILETDDRLGEGKKAFLGSSYLGNVRVSRTGGGEKSVAVDLLLPKEPKKDIKMPALNGSDIVAIADAADSLVDTVLSMKDKRRQADKIEKVIEEAGDSLRDALNEDVASSDKRTIEKLMNSLLSYERLALNTDRQLNSWAAAVSSAVLSYGKESLSNLKKDK